MRIDRGVKVENLTFSNFFCLVCGGRGLLGYLAGWYCLTLLREDDISALLVWLCCLDFFKLLLETLS